MILPTFDNVLLRPRDVVWFIPAGVDSWTVWLRVEGRGAIVHVDALGTRWRVEWAQ